MLRRSCLERAEELMAILGADINVLDNENVQDVLCLHAPLEARTSSAEEARGSEWSITPMVVRV